MTRHDFIAYALKGELDLNRLAAKLGIARKYRWEEPLVITAENRQLFAGDGPAVPRVYLYYFGGLVFLNCSDRIIQGFFRELAGVGELFRDYPDLKYTDRYSLAVNDGDQLEITNDYAVMPQYSAAFVDIISFVIAKSVALERIEEQVDTVLDEMEGLIGLLDRGNPRPPGHPPGVDHHCPHLHRNSHLPLRNSEKGALTPHGAMQFQGESCRDALQGVSTRYVLLPLVLHSLVELGMIKRWTRLISTVWNGKPSVTSAASAALKRLRTTVAPSFLPPPPAATWMWYRGSAGFMHAASR